MDTIKVCDTNETHLAPIHQDSLDTFYSHCHSSYPQCHPAYRPQWHQPWPPSYQSSPPVMYPPAFSDCDQGWNPHNKKGEITYCLYCHSINHYRKDCPDEHLYASGSFSCRYQPPYQPSPTTLPVCKTYLQEEETYDNFEPDDNDHFYKVVLFQTDYNPGCLSGLIAKSWNSGVLDSGATKTVSGQAWLDTYLNSLPDSSSITWSASNNIYCFGDGHKVQAMKSATIPVILIGHQVHLTTDALPKTYLYLFPMTP